LIDKSLLDEAASLLEEFRGAGLRLATAESCTGGLVAAILTAVPGSSDVVERGFVTYSNAAKSDLLGVDPALIARVGAVSAEVAAAMARGGLARSRAEVVVAVTGIAGPSGGTPSKPVGLVFLAGLRRGGEPLVEQHIFVGDRAGVRLASVRGAFALARAVLAG